MKNNKDVTPDTPITLLPGKYWIGDLFYANEELWADIFEKIHTGNGFDHNGEIEIKGLKLWYHYSEIGDGCYQILKNTLQNAKVHEGGFFENGGLFGIMPFQLTDGSDQDCSYGVTVSFSDEVKCFCEDGLFRFKSGKGELILNYIPDTLAIVVRALAELKELNVSEMLTQNEVGSVGKLINNINSYYQLAVTAIRDEYENGREYSVKYYVKRHLKQLGQCFEKSDPKTFSIDLFLSKLRLSSISLSPEDVDECACFDYTIRGVWTDDIIVVRFNPLGQVEFVSIES